MENNKHWKILNIKKKSKIIKKHKHIFDIKKKVKIKHYTHTDAPYLNAKKKLYILKTTSIFLHTL